MDTKINKNETKEATKVETGETGEFTPIPVSEEDAVKGLILKQQTAEALDIARQEIGGVSLAKKNLLDSGIGYTDKSLEELKNNFSKMTGAEAYTPFEVLLLKQTLKLLDGYRKDPKNEKDTGSVNMLGKKVKDAAIAIEGTDRKAPKAYDVLMDNFLEKFGNLKNGFNSVDFYKGFGDDLASVVLSEEQREKIAEISKASEYKKPENVSILKSIANIFTSSMSQTGAKNDNSIFSDRSVYELAGEPTPEIKLTRSLAKSRALKYVDRGDLQGAIDSVISDMDKISPNELTTAMGLALKNDPTLTKEKAEEFINGFPK